MKIYNLMTGSGFEGGAFSSSWIKAWAVIALIVILCYALVILTRNYYIPFSFSWNKSTIVLGLVFILITFFGFIKISLMAGLITILILSQIQND